MLFADNRFETAVLWGIIAGMARIGERATLRILREEGFGVFLAAEDDLVSSARVGPMRYRVRVREVIREIMASSSKGMRGRCAKTIFDRVSTAERTR